MVGTKKNMIENNFPLAERMRPSSLTDLVGQEHLTGPNGILTRVIASGNVPSTILWGPPGVGKTTIANIIANQVKRPFKTLSAVSAGVKDVREIINQSRISSKTILFIDEIHRFNKTQQDALLAAVEKGIITLIGATTENPSFEINSALLSRCQVYALNGLTTKSLEKLIKQALKKDTTLSEINVNILENDALFKIADGDARRVLNLLELVVTTLMNTEPEVVITNDKVKQIAQQNVAIYDKKGDMHYDVISAFIKSVRGSDPNAAVYYLARMIEGGEDVKFIARRMIILASEDIGNANPTALVMATNTFQAVSMIGYPEARIILSQCATYLASSPKSNASYAAINKAQTIVNETGNLPIPNQIKNAPTHLSKEFGHGKGYRYAHDHQDSFVEMEFLPLELTGQKIYDPGANPRENEIRQRLRKLWKEKYGY